MVDECEMNLAGNGEGIEIEDSNFLEFDNDGDGEKMRGSDEMKKRRRKKRHPRIPHPV
jgi:hypothetical protein